MTDKLPDRVTFVLTEDLKGRLTEIKKRGFWGATYSEMIRYLLVEGIDAWERETDV